MNLTLNDNFGVRYIDDDIVIFDKTKTHLDEMYKFSDSARLIVDKILNKVNFKDIINDIITIYDVDNTTAEKDFKAFIIDLINKNIFIYNDTN